MLGSLLYVHLNIIYLYVIIYIYIYITIMCLLLSLYVSALCVYTCVVKGFSPIL
jgi:hypothetical protein